MATAALLGEGPIECHGWDRDMGNGEMKTMSHSDVKMFQCQEPGWDNVPFHILS